MRRNSMYGCVYRISRREPAEAYSTSLSKRRCVNVRHESRSILADLSTNIDAELQSWSKLRCVVRIIPTFNWSDSPFDAGRINPLRSNLRNVKPSSSPIPDSNTPTPIYNSDLAAEGSILPTARYLQEISARSKSYHEAAMLLKIWALQRGLQKESGLSHCLYLLSILLAYVFEGKCKGIRSVPSGSSPWQATKAAFEVLGRCACNGTSRFSTLELLTEVSSF